MMNNVGSADLFKQAFNQVLLASECVTLFDHGWATLHGAGYHSTVYKYSIANGYIPMEFEGQHLRESSLIKHICLPSAQSIPDLSPYRRLSAAMEERNSGLIIVHNAHLLSNKATHLLARLATFIRGKELDWKIVLFADTKCLDLLNFAQLAVEKTFPDSCLELDWTPNTPIKHKATNLGKPSNLIKYAAAAALGLLVLTIALNLTY